LSDLNKIQTLLEQYEEYLLSLQQDLKERGQNAVPGSLHVLQTEKRTQYYHRTSIHDDGFLDDSDQRLPGRRREHYLSKAKEGRLIQTLAQQDYDRDLTAAVDQQLAAVRSARMALQTRNLEDVYSDLLPARKQLITPLVPDRERFLEEWASVTWVRKGFEPNTPEFYSARKERVRSKSEKIIADHYNNHSFYYRYEYPLSLRNGRGMILFHPDFMVLNKRTLQPFYHEHLGKMDDPDYISRVLWRINIYEENGIFPRENLFFTTETSKSPFTTAQLDRMIRHYLL